MGHEETYAQLRQALLSRHFALGKFWRANLFTNVNVLGEVAASELPPAGETTLRACFEASCVPRRNGTARFSAENDPVQISDIERWRVWNHDRTNALKMSGLRAIQLCAEHRLGEPHARQIINLLLDTTASLFKFPEASPWGGYVLRWDPATCDDWELEIDAKGNCKPKMPCRFLLNTDLKNFNSQRFLYCTPLSDPRYRKAVQQGIDTDTPGRDQGWGQDRFRRWEPSKDEYIGLLCGLSVIFDAFPSDSVILEKVRKQVRRIARYLQHTGYLLARPCGGVTARGSGEILPLLEFPFSKVYQKILGESFVSTSSYARTLEAAGIRPGQVVTSTLLALRQSALDKIIHDIRETKWLNELKEKLGIEGDILSDLEVRQREELARFWINRQTIDAVHSASEGEVFQGFVLNALPRSAREKLYYKWLHKSGTGVFDGFKPYLAYMLMDDSDTRTRKSYLEWFEATFSSPPSPPQPKVVDDKPDWTFANSVYLLALHREGRTADYQHMAGVIEQYLGKMNGEIHEHSGDVSQTEGAKLVIVQGQGSSPLPEMEGEHCTLSGVRRVAAEFHEKRGNWYGYMSMMALTWQHLLEASANPFSDIALPTQIPPWPEAMVPKEVINAVYTDRMPVPLNAINQNGLPAILADALLFSNPPPKPHDNDLVELPDPRGRDEVIDVRGGILRRTIDLRFSYPQLDLDSEEAEFWQPVPSFNEEIKVLVESYEFVFENGECIGKVVLKPIEIVRNGLRLPRTRFARLKGRLSLAWVRQN